VTVVLSFAGGPSDGAGPPAGLILDGAGNLYGMTVNSGYGGAGYGVAFKLAPDGALTVLHAFTAGSGGYSPTGGLLLDGAGNLYGTTAYGGTPPPYGHGVAFKLAPDGTYTVLHAFTAGSDGYSPTGGLIADGAGNLYGTAGGGASGGGVVFKLAGTGFVTTPVQPPLVPLSQVAATASGLAYSRVSQTFTGSVTLTNLSGGAVSGPVQIFFTGLPAGVTLANATGNFAGTPYLTVPALASLPAGQAVTLSVQFKDPSNAPITFTPALHSGSF
jgi:uncharacterized repeat protein (TIGR03803 family)